MRSKKAVLAAVAIGLGLLPGCVSHQVDDHSFQFNEATGSLGMRLLLLNAVRASKDYPLQFSKISLYQGKGAMGSASISASMPLKIPSNGSLSPKVDWNDGVSRIDLIDLNTEEAQEALKKTLTYHGYAYHTAFSGNRSSILPQFLLLEQVALSSKLSDVIKESVQCTCDIVNLRQCNPRSIIDHKVSKPIEELKRKSERDGSSKDRLKIMAEYLRLKRDIAKLEKLRSDFVKDLREGKSSVAKEIQHACASLVTIDEECPNEKFPRTMDSKVVLKNDLTTECRHKIFMYGLLQSRIIGMATRAKQREGDKPDEVDKPDPGGKKGDAKKTTKKRTQEEGGNTFNIFTVDPNEKKKEKEEVNINVLNPIFAARCLNESLCDMGVESPVGIRREHISPLLRSPERLVRYLGELVSAQNYGAQTFKPSLLDPEREGQKFSLLTVKRGLPPPGGAAVSIVDPEGETFYVPRRQHDAPKTDLSLETLAIVSDVLNAAVSKKAFPPVTTLTVASP